MGISPFRRTDRRKKNIFIKFLLKLTKFIKVKVKHLLIYIEACCKHQSVRVYSGRGGIHGTILHLDTKYR